MGPLNPENDAEQDLDDSGYVQDEAATKEGPPAATKEGPPAAVQVKRSPGLLDLSDDVLLNVLKYCKPLDLKALGYSCSRLCVLVLDRTLWQYVDARDYPSGRKRIRWLLTHALSVHTTTLLLSGFAREAKGCLGFISSTWMDEKRLEYEISHGYPAIQPWEFPEYDMNDTLIGGPELVHVTGRSFPRHGNVYPDLPEDLARTSNQVRPREPVNGEPTRYDCPGPQVTFTTEGMTRLTALCPNLVELALDYAIIDCYLTKIGLFPPTLRKLSLRGTKCYNLEKSFLYKIQEGLVDLEELDVSHCEWVEPACMLPLSKMPALKRLVMRDCPKLAEFVAYASLATRYGFKTLKILDMRGSPVGDSEVSALGWVPQLEELYLSPAPPLEKAGDHVHFSHDPWPRHHELEPWEEQEPDYYRSKYNTQPWVIEERSNRPRRNYYDDNSGGSGVVPQHGDTGAPERYRERFPAYEAVQPYQYRDKALCHLNLPPPRWEPFKIIHPPRPLEQIMRQQALERRRYGISDATGINGTYNGFMRRNLNIYPDGDVNPVSLDNGENGVNEADDAQKALKKRKQEDAGDDSGSSKRPRDLAYDPEIASNEPGSAHVEPSSPPKDPSSSHKDPSSSSKDPSSSSKDQSSSSKDPSSSSKDPSSSNKDPNSSYKVPSSSDEDLSGSPNRMNYSEEDELSRFDVSPITHEQCATKAARKYYDNTDSCQVSRAQLKDSLNDFKKRTENMQGPIYKPTNDPAVNFESDYEQSTDDDDDDEDQPRSKRTRLFMIERAAKFYKSCVDNNDGQASTFRNEEARDLTTGPSRSTAEPSRPDTEPSQPSAKSSLPTAEPNLPSTSKQNPAQPSPKDEQLNLVVESKAKDLSVASTSGQSKPTQKEPSDKETNDKEPSENEPSQNADDEPKQRFVRFRQNEPPIVVEGCVPNVSVYNDNFNLCNNNNFQERDWNDGSNSPMLPSLDSEDEEYLHHKYSDSEESANSRRDMSRNRVLYVNVARRQYQSSAPYTKTPPPRRVVIVPPAHLNLVFSPGVVTRVDHTTLVTDAALRRFGRADGDNINYVQIGPMGPMPAPYDDPHARPNRSNLRVLSVTGYRYISDYSLTHLVTAAPHLHTLDFTGTRVTESGVEHFRNLRPDCNVIFGPNDDSTEDPARAHSR